MAERVSGLVLPHLSEPDPELAGEGSLDPLGLFPIAVRLAEEVAPGITARMSRIRFLSAIAASTCVIEGLENVVAADSASTPDLAFEWLVVEALARRSGLPPEATLRVPGIEKARSVVSRGGHLGSAVYLKTAKVFGFHGVYKRLAIALGIVAADLSLLERGEELVRTWEQEQKLEGFVDRRSGTPGGSLAQRVQNAVRSAAEAGRVQESHQAWLWGELAGVLRPDGAGPKEKRILLGWLNDEAQPLRREFVRRIQDLSEVESERDGLRALRVGASKELAMRLDAIEAYERVSELLQGLFDWLCYRSTESGTQPIVPDLLPAEGLPAEVLRQLPEALRLTSERLAPFGLEVSFEAAFGQLQSATTVGELTHLMLDRHERVQRAKPPRGKRPWFDSSGDGFVIRLPYRISEAPELAGTYLHPYRLIAVRFFLEDLR
jgi:hypothetical protein